MPSPFRMDFTVLCLLIMRDISGNSVLTEEGGAPESARVELLANTTNKFALLTESKSRTPLWDDIGGAEDDLQKLELKEFKVDQNILLLLGLFSNKFFVWSRICL